MVQIILGYTMDLFIGDPYWLFHPVRWIGQLILMLEKRLLKEESGKKQKFKGLLLLIIVSSLSFVIPFYLLRLAFNVHILLGLFVEAFMIYQIFATKCLDVETKKVYKALKSGDINEARKAISYLVSRDTETMTDEDIIKASIETIAENLGDGVIAPMFFVVIGGAPLGWYYKSVNTLDSMVGYKNDKFNHYGYCSAKWDDVLNYVPARLTAIFILMAGLFLRLNLKNGLKMLKRDKHNHSSPNSAFPESAAAGLLDIQLGGKASYFGEVSMKPTMGDANKKIRVEDLYKMKQLLYISSGIGLFVLLCCRSLWELL
ncbi:MAG: cobalamin biosynthesis protein CobD [Clostridiales bacterium]|nr:cobalamin biosynthesis protein CobD [Clostridiales bacterium]